MIKTKENNKYIYPALQIILLIENKKLETEILNRITPIFCPNTDLLSIENK